MKKSVRVKTITLSLALILCGIISAQENGSCKVLLEAISDSYNGDCKNGLAEGKGKARGIDFYKGKFKNGLPDGKGKYEYANGNEFTGNFKNGLKHGEGKFVYSLGGKSYNQKGFWVNGDYVGLTNSDVPYRVEMNFGIDQIKINKLDTHINQIKISFYALLIKTVPVGLKINASSGQVIQTGQDFYITNFSEASNFIDIEYIVKKGGVDKTCMVSFEILEKGNYEVSLTNE